MDKPIKMSGMAYYELFLSHFKQKELRLSLFLELKEQVTSMVGLNRKLTGSNPLIV